MLPASARALMAGAVDYAGLFPPAQLPLADALAEYRRALSGADAWMLGRFIVPAVQLSVLADGVVRGAQDGRGWTVSAIVREHMDEDAAAVQAFNHDAANEHVRVDTIECRPSSSDSITWLAKTFSPAFTVHVEVCAGPTAPDDLRVVARHRLRAKVRTGGLAPDAFPAPASLVAFIESARDLGVPFKATAGLHHAMRGAYPLSDEVGAQSATMYGFVNLMLATATIGERLPTATAAALLTRTDHAALVFDDERVRWGDIELSIDAIGRMRETQCVSFGSCSFREPADEYRRFDRSHAFDARG
ncbi:MAG: hypothetical protein ABIX28_01755 [Vicinamibacterales bacterium]